MLTRLCCKLTLSSQAAAAGCTHDNSNVAFFSLTVINDSEQDYNKPAKYFLYRWFGMPHNIGCHALICGQ